MICVLLLLAYYVFLSRVFVASGVSFCMDRYIYLEYGCRSQVGVIKWRLRGCLLDISCSIEYSINCRVYEADFLALTPHYLQVMLCTHGLTLLTARVVSLAVDFDHLVALLHSGYTNYAIRSAPVKLAAPPFLATQITPAI